MPKQTDGVWNAIVNDESQGSQLNLLNQNLDWSHLLEMRWGLNDGTIKLIFKMLIVSSGIRHVMEIVDSTIILYDDVHQNWSSHASIEILGIVVMSFARSLFGY